MKMIKPVLACLCVSFAVLFLGCRHKTDANSELDKAAASFGPGEPASAPAPPAAEAAAPAPAPAEGAALPQVPALPAGTPAQQMHLAIASYKAGELEDAVIRLQKLRAMPTLTAAQRMAVQDGVAAVMTEIYGQAAKGDARAAQAVRQYEEMQTSRR
jgi:hypothetical protein